MSADENDPDSSMLSTPSDEDGHDSDQNLCEEDGGPDQELFPSTDRPATPKNNHLNATAPGELSPPQSQSTSQMQLGVGEDDTVHMGGMADDDATVVYSNEHDIEGTTGEMVNGQGQAQPAWVPGAGWKNKKAREEYQRAIETLVDRDFSLREFGDLFDDRAVLQQQQQRQDQDQEQLAAIGEDKTQ